MFYSQFILAKKGPLGTIWIAAHLERKLRKNQVADTDIGVSVDTILCPEVPIALRLSSHLLLGVVRIYSRKVNYLFDDCSEALLKIKHAFRSTAVDLPPEESKAPYHSITLPETFDLDDFELPDNDIYQGSYVDHHTSTREQITLQDNMEGVVYSTSQFGLDERFGDGETSGLNLDEEFFLPKVDNAAGVSGDHPSSAHAATPMQDEGYGGLPAYPESRIENLNVEGDLMDYAQAPCTPGLMETPNLANVQEISACEDHMDDDDNPLVEFALNGNSETISSKLSQHQENAQLVDWSLSDDKNSVAAVDIPCEENGNHFIDLDIEKWHSPKETPAQNIAPDDPASALGTSAIADEAQGSGQASNLTEIAVSLSTFLDKKQQLEDVILKGDGVNVPSVSNEDHRECNGIITKGSAQDASCSISCLQMPEGVSDDNQTAPFGEKTKDMEVSGNPGRLTSCSGALELSFEQQGLSSLEQPEDTHMSNVDVCDEMTCPQVHILRPCSAGLELPDSSHPGGEVSNDLNMAPDVGEISLESSGGGEMIHASGPVIVLQDGKFLNLKENHTPEPGLVEDGHAGSGKSDIQVNNVVGGGSMVENVSSSVSAVIPAPEKLLSLPEGHNNHLRGPLLEATPGDLACVDESDAGSRIFSGKKRSYTESTLTEQSLYSVGSTRVVRAERTAEAIPDDDDLLSSILVGRSSSVLKVKPTPPPYEKTSLKRRRHAPRTSASKRKVLMDDTMVLHGDAIRQQLTNTEDIRRLRKKAPCTVPEISSIQKQFLEDELFVEPLCSGVSVALVSLFNQGYDLSRIKVSKDDANGTPVLSASDMKVISSNEGIENVTVSDPAVMETGVRNCGEFAAVKENCDLQLDETIVLSRNKLDEGHELCMEPSITDLEINHTENKEDAEPASSLPCLPPNLADNEIRGTNLPSEAVGVAQLTSPDKGVDADALLEMEAAAVSFSDIKQSENVMEPSITDLEINHTENKEDAEPASSLPCLPQNLADNEIGGTNVPSEAVGVAQLTSPDKGVDADALLKMEAAAVSFADKRESENVMEAAAVSCDDKREADDVMMDASLVNGERNVDEERFDRVKFVDTLATIEVEPNESDAVLLEGAQCDGAVEFDRYYGEQVQYDACGMSVELEADMSRGDYNEALCGGTSGGPPILTSSHPSEFKDLQGSFLDNGEYLIQHEGYPSNMVGAEISGLDMQDYNDYNYSAAANDTEFLNVDDDEVAEFTDDYVANAEETRVLDNSGWSSRTRAVGNYLQTLFMKEAEHDRKVLPLDNVLVGKTRKEACRMFFETLVLKTKDYIQVEQECPFQNINIKPKMKLLKSDF